MDELQDFKSNHQSLYGFLLLADQKIKNVGANCIWYIGLAAFAFCVAIHMKWCNSFFGIPVIHLRGYGVYTLILLSIFVAWFIYISVGEKRVYADLKPD